MTWLITWFFVLFFYVSCPAQLTADVTIDELSPIGFSLKAHLSDDLHLKEISFSDGSSIRYEHKEKKLSKIIRYDSFGKELYAQTYVWEGDRLLSQTGWFTTEYIYDDAKVIAKLNPWLHETIEYDPSGNPLQIGNKHYSYDAIGQITEEKDSFYAVYDKSYNPIELNGKTIAVDDENKVLKRNYDFNGNLLIEGVTYGENNLIAEACGERYFYDSQGRLVQNGDTCYLYLGWEEIASFKNGECKTLKIPGIGGPIAIEIDGKPYAPIVDSAGIIRKLIDPLTDSIYKENDCNIFGGGLTDDIPYAYRGKRYEPLTDLIYFGRRFYDPSLHRWVSPDPLGPIDHENLYQYVYNNPLKYCDPTGTSFWGYVLGIGEIVAGGAVMAGGVCLEAATFGGFTIGFTIVEGSGLALMTDGFARAVRESQDLQPPKWDNFQWKEATKKPPRFNGKDLGLDPSQCPGQGFEWRGKGSPESGRGNWINPSTGEKLHPDLQHPPGKAPHWGFTDSEGNPYDLFIDGSWE